jgi:hypothetical protein
MPRFDNVLSGQAQSAIAITRAGEIAHVSGYRTIRKEWSTIRLEALYELAYLRVFAAWEVCLEAVFYRSLRGYASTAGQEALVGGRYYVSVAAAELAVLSGRSYVLWHNPQKVIERCRRFIKSGAGGGPCVQESMLSANLSRLEDFSTIRHRIVHDQQDAKRKFDAATLTIAARTYSSSRPGKFLRDWDTSTVPPKRWLEVTILETIGLIKQIV